MIKRIVFLSFFILFSSCSKKSAYLNLSLKGLNDQIQGESLISGASIATMVPEGKDNVSLNLKLPQGIYFLFDYFPFFLSKKEEKIHLDMQKNNIDEVISQKLSLENKTFYQIVKKWEERIQIIYVTKEEPEEFWKNNAVVMAQTSQILSDPKLDKDFVYFQKKDMEYAQKWISMLYLNSYEMKFDEKLNRLVPSGKKFSPSERKKLVDFVKQVDMNDEALFFNGLYYRRILPHHVVYDVSSNQEKNNFLNGFYAVDKTFKSQIIKDYFWFHQIKICLLGDCPSKYLETNYEVYIKKAKNSTFKNYIKTLYKRINRLKGAKAPEFSYEDINGKKVSLSDFKGNYVYIDFWATWCGPCLVESPYLKKLAQEYKDKPIKFLGISLDKNEDREKWKEMVVKEGLDKLSIQLIADKGFDSEFSKVFNPRKAIPCYVLLDKEGNVLEANAPRPSFKKEIKELFDSLP